MEKAEQKVVTGPRALPVILYGGDPYFSDLRLAEFRAALGPLDPIAFGSEQGKKMCLQAGIITCKSCQMNVIISRVFVENPLHCMNCFQRL